MGKLKLKGWAQKEEEKLEDLSEFLVTLKEPSSPASEAYLNLRTNLLYTLVDVAPKIIAIASPGSYEGKSVICANLGVVLAQAGKSTLLVDCAFRRPHLHKLFALYNLLGVVNVLRGEYSLERVWQEPVESLKVVGVGPLPPDPVEILSSERFAEFLSQVRQSFDYVLLDTPPTHPLTDTKIVAKQADGVVLVVDAQNTRRAAARRSAHDLEAVGAVVLGTVVNQVEDV